MINRFLKSVLARRCGSLWFLSLPVVVGDVYTFTLEGRISGGSLRLRARLTDETTSTSISVTATDSANILGGSFFGYFNNVRVKDGGTVTINADFADFFARRRR
jgi:hypothetical protein